MSQSCKTCAHAGFVLTPTGRIMRNVAGKCHVEYDMPPIPECVKISFHRISIWPDMGEKCITYTKKEKA